MVGTSRSHQEHGWALSGGDGAAGPPLLQWHGTAVVTCLYPCYHQHTWDINWVLSTQTFWTWLFSCSVARIKSYRSWKGNELIMISSLTLREINPRPLSTLHLLSSAFIPTSGQGGYTATSSCTEVKAKLDFMYFGKILQGFLSEGCKAPAASMEYWGAKKMPAEFTSAQNILYVTFAYSALTTSNHSMQKRRHNRSKEV